MTTRSYQNVEHLCARLLLRLERLGVVGEEFPYGEQLAWLQRSDGEGEFDIELYGLIDDHLANLEGNCLRTGCPFVPPLVSLDQGDVHLGDTATGPVKCSIADS